MRRTLLYLKVFEYDHYIKTPPWISESRQNQDLINKYEELKKQGIFS